MQRLKLSFFAAFLHFLFSILLLGSFALLIFFFWFPEDFKDITGSKDLFWLIFSVDVVCGPLLTLLIFDPKKSKNELRKDLFLIAAIQLVALGYGVYTLSQIKPIALVYEIDRFRLISFSDLDEYEKYSNVLYIHDFLLSEPKTFGIRMPLNGEEALESIDASLQGLEPSQRPSWWQDYKISIPQALQRSRPISDLRTKHPEQTVLIDAAVTKALHNIEPGETTDVQALRWLPLVSRRATDWVVLLDPITARARGYVHLDGF